MLGTRRYALITMATLLLVAACGGGLSTLHAKGRASGEGPAQLDVQNHSGAQLVSIYVAETDAVNKARAAGVDPGTDEDQALWGEDTLGRDSLYEGSTHSVGAVPAGRYDVLIVDPDHREQLISGLRLKAGGKYVLEVLDGNWRRPN